MPKSRLVYIALSAVVSAVLLALLFSRIKTEDVVQTFFRIHVPALLIYMAVALLGACLRAWRYKIFLRPQPIGWGHILLATFIRNSLVDLLPARIGSLSYIVVLNKRLSFPFEAVTSSFVLSFVLDFLSLSPFLVAAVLAVGLGTSVISTPVLLWISLIFFCLILLILWQLVPIFRAVLSIYQRLIRFFHAEPKRWAAVSSAKFSSTIDSLSQTGARNIYFPVFILSLFIRLAKYVSVFALFFALLRSHGFSLHTLSFWMFILGISGAELTSALPIKGLAGFGTWESAWAVTFKLMKFDPRLAIISGIGVHLLTNIFEYSLGIASILILAWPYFRRNKGKP